MRTKADIIVERWTVTALATRWLGTPWHHGAAVRGSGVDCAHLAAAVYEEAGILDTMKIGYYAPEWFLHEDAERLLDRVREFCVEVETPGAGDLALFAFGRASAHVGIVLRWPSMIHADRPRGVVTRETVEPEGPLARRLTGWWSPAPWHEEEA